MACLHNRLACLGSLHYKNKKKPLYDYINELMKQHKYLHIHTSCKNMMHSSYLN
jgi:hypothetical protein